MKSLRYICACAALFVVVPNTLGQDFLQEQPPLTLEDCINIAVGNSPSISQANFEAIRAQGQAVKAGQKPNPIVGYRASQVNRGGQAGEHGIFVEKQIVVSDRLDWARQTHLHEAEMANIEQEMERHKVTTLVSCRFYELLAEATRIEAIESRLARIREQREKFQTGMSMPPAIDRLLRMEKIKSDADMRSAILAQQRAERALAIAMGLPQLHNPIDGNLNSLPNIGTWEETLETVWNNSPEVALVEARICRERAKANEEREKNRPDLFTSTAVQYDDLYNLPQVTFQIGVPIGVHGKNDGAVMAANANLSRAGIERDRVRRAIANRLVRAYEEYQSAIANIPPYDSYLTDAQKSYEQFLNEYHSPDPTSRGFHYSVVIDADRLILSTKFEKTQLELERNRLAALISGNVLTDSFDEAPVFTNGAGTTPFVAK